MRLNRRTPMDWRKDWTLHRRKTTVDSLGDAVPYYDMSTSDFTGAAGTASGICWQVKSQEWAVKEFGEDATGGATFDLFLDELEIAPFDRCVFGGGVWEVRSVLPRSNHRHITLTVVNEHGD